MLSCTGRLASRVRMPAYAARVQQQWRRQLIALDQEKLEALWEDAEGSGSESEGGGGAEPQFGMLRVQVSYVNEPLWSPEQGILIVCCNWHWRMMLR